MKIIYLYKSRLFQHIIFWGVAEYILLLHFQASSQLAPTDFIYTGLFSIFIFVMVYFNLAVLMSRLFQKGLYWQYTLALATSTVILTFLQIFMFDYLVEWLFPGYYLISYLNYWQTLEYFVIFVGITTLLHLSKSWFLYKDSQTKLSLAQKEKAEAELLALKNQINPHFLFNSLNSVYSLVLKKDIQAPEALIKLSDSLRYVIYDSDNEKVELSKEIDFIQNFIELQKLRISEQHQIFFALDGVIERRLIAPLLFLPIIENCFKHGIKADTQPSFVDINIFVGDSSISLISKNKINISVEQAEIHGSGMGLANLRHRLELLYPGKHQLNISQKDDIYEVILNIEL